MQNAIKKIIATGIICLGSITTAWASSIQVFSGINYSNPADLTLFINDMQLLIGDDLIIPNVVFQGTTFVPSPVAPSFFSPVVTAGTTSTNISYSLPYGRFAKRLSKQWVVSVDVTEPFKSDVIYNQNSFLRYLTTISKTHSVDIGLNAAYQFSGFLSKLSVGLGFDILNFSAVLNSVYPSLPSLSPLRDFGAGPDLLVEKIARGNTYGWHAGLLYHALEGTFLDLSYFSTMTPRIVGTSILTGYNTTNNAYTNVNLPSTLNFAVTQFFSRKWMVSVGTNYTIWNRLQRINIFNIAGPVTTETLLPHYRNTWRFSLSTLYHVIPPLDVVGTFSFDQTPTNMVDRNVTQPEVNHLSLGLYLEYRFIKNWSVGTGYAHTFYPGGAAINYMDPNDFAKVRGLTQVSADTVSAWLRVNI